MFLFVHIEKCGGTTLSDMLSLSFPRYLRITKNNYGGNDIRNDITPLQFKKLLKYIPSGIGGHCIRPYAIEYRRPVSYITFFRNPIERYMSHLNHNIEGGWSQSFTDFSRKEYYNDFMTKKIANSNDFSLACKYLDQFEFIGDVNQYNKSLDRLADVLDAKLYGDSIIKNERKFKENYVFFDDLSSREKLIVEEVNKNDIRLYEKYILQTNILNVYSDNFQLKRPSDLRVRIIRKLNKFKKENIINPIRME